MATKQDEYPRARVIKVDGQIMLEDPDAVEMIRAISLAGFHDHNKERIEHFRGRAKTLEKTSEEAVIVLLNVDDPIGGELASILMPGHDWQAYRDRGEIPIARGLAVRDWIQDALGAFYIPAATKLKTWDFDRLAVVAVDHGVAEVF